MSNNKNLKDKKSKDKKSSETACTWDRGHFYREKASIFSDLFYEARFNQNIKHPEMPLNGWMRISASGTLYINPYSKARKSNKLQVMVVPTHERSSLSAGHG